MKGDSDVKSKRQSKRKLKGRRTENEDRQGGRFTVAHCHLWLSDTRLMSQAYFLPSKPGAD